MHHLHGNTCFGEYQIRVHQHKHVDNRLLENCLDNKQLELISDNNFNKLPLKQMKYLIHSKGCGCKVTSSLIGQF